MASGGTEKMGSGTRQCLLRGRGGWRHDATPRPAFKFLQRACVTDPAFLPRHLYSHVVNLIDLCFGICGKPYPYMLSLYLNNNNFFFNEFFTKKKIFLLSGVEIILI